MSKKSRVFTAEIKVSAVKCALSAKGSAHWRESSSWAGRCFTSGRIATGREARRYFVKSRPTSTPPCGGAKPLMNQLDRVAEWGHGWTRSATHRIQLFCNERNTLDGFAGGVEVGRDFACQLWANNCPMAESLRTAGMVPHLRRS